MSFFVCKLLDCLSFLMCFFELFKCFFGFLLGFSATAAWHFLDSISWVSWFEDSYGSLLWFVWVSVDDFGLRITEVVALGAFLLSILALRLTPSKLSFSDLAPLVSAYTYDSLLAFRSFDYCLSCFFFFLPFSSTPWFASSSTSSGSSIITS